MDLWQSLARVPRRPTRGDYVLAAVLALWAVLEALFVQGPGSRPARIAFALAVTLPLLARRRAPLLVIAFIAAISVPWVLDAKVAEAGVNPFPSLLVMSFSAALYERHLIGAIAGGLVTLGVMLTALFSTNFNNAGTPRASNLAILGFFMFGAWTAARLVRQRAEQAQAAMLHSEDRARSAVSDERARIARELHDVVAHSISIVAVQAGAAEQLIEHDPATAREHLQALRHTAREAMSEMRRLLDVLRTEDPGLAPQPGLARLTDLVEESRRAGLEVSVHEEGERPGLGAGVDLVAFRIIQEALTNARKHAPGAPAAVALRYGPHAVEIEIVNALRATNGHRPEGAGHGLIGMRERAVLFGGMFSAGAEDGRFRVHAVLPLAEEFA